MRNYLLIFEFIITFYLVYLLLDTLKYEITWSTENISLRITLYFGIIICVSIE